MTTQTNNAGTHMKRNPTNQTGSREAPDSSVRPANPTRKQWADAYRAARKIGPDAFATRANAHQLARILAAFGGRVTAVETNTQATA